MEFFKASNINFIGNRNKAFTVSLVFITISLISIVFHKGFNLSIDFIGGTMVRLKFEKPVVHDLAKIRSIISTLNFGTPEVKTIGSLTDNEISIIVKKKEVGTSSQVSEEIKKALATDYSENPFEVRRQEQVGAKVGGEASKDTFLAILISLIVIVIYIAIRFQLPFGIGAVLALVHDTIITLGVFSIINAEISLPVIAAVLTIIGYSLNDTIVIFDRIRENFSKSISKRSIIDRINDSINETLSRTIITAGTTLFAVLTIYGFFFSSGDVLKLFALALLVGIITGTYSSIYIASSFLILWNKKWPLKISGSTK